MYGIPLGFQYGTFLGPTLGVIYGTPLATSDGLEKLPKLVW